MDLKERILAATAIIVSSGERYPAGIIFAYAVSKIHIPELRYIPEILQHLDQFIRDRKIKVIQSGRNQEQTRGYVVLQPETADMLDWKQLANTASHHVAPECPKCRSILIKGNLELFWVCLNCGVKACPRCCEIMIQSETGQWVCSGCGYQA